MNDILWRRERRMPNSASGWWQIAYAPLFRGMAFSHARSGCQRAQNRAAQRPKDKNERSFVGQSIENQQIGTRGARFGVETRSADRNSRGRIPRDRGSARCLDARSPVWDWKGLGRDWVGTWFVCTVGSVSSGLHRVWPVQTAGNFFSQMSRGVSGCLPMSLGVSWCLICTKVKKQTQFVRNLWPGRE
jgi:hypothetical protein